MTSTLRVVAAVLVMSAVLCGCVSAARVQPCKDWVLYKQCGESWSDHELGTAAGVTICDAGMVLCVRLCCLGVCEWDAPVCSVQCYCSLRCVIASCVATCGVILL